MHITIFEVEEWESKAFEGLEKEHHLEFVEEPLTEENAARYAETEIISTFIYSGLNREVLEQLGQLKLIATRSTGFDHIDSDYCGDKGITVCNVPTYGDNTVAEHVFGLLLALSHNLVEAANRTQRGDFSLQGLHGFDLRGKTLGVIGTGSIGQCVIEIANGFRMAVIASDVKEDEEAAARLGFSYVDLAELLSTADIITLHVPANEKTRHMLSDEEFAQMKPGVILINTARGSVVDTNALGRALADGKVAAAGLDVLPEEPVIREEAELLHTIFHKKHNLETLLSDHVLLRLRNVIITPHSAFNTREAIERILDTTFNNITSFVQGRPQNVVVSRSE